MGFSPSTSLINAIGAPALPVHGRDDDDVSLSVDNSLNMSPEVVKKNLRRSLRDGLSNKHSYRNWTNEASQPQAMENGGQLNKRFVGKKGCCNGYFESA